MSRWTKREADDLDSHQVSSLVEFMKAKADGHFVLHGKSLEVIGLSNKKVKFLLRKFLYANHLSEYNVLARADTFEIGRIRHEAKSKEDERLKHPMPFVPMPPPPTAVKSRLVVEWQGKPPRRRWATRNDIRACLEL